MSSFEHQNITKLAIPYKCFHILADRLLQVDSTKRGAMKNFLNIAVDIVTHPATHDDEFVDVLLMCKQLRENTNLLKTL